MEYNSVRPKLVLKEYGRHVQSIVENCLAEKDPERRNQFAKEIIELMGQLNPHLRNVEDFKHKLWDHVAIMSDFKLDIDFPYEILLAENLYTRPEIIPYKKSRIRYQHYGRTLEEMIEKVAGYEEGDEKNELIRLIANQMKKCFLTWNKEVVDDRKIFDDVRELSKGNINISEDFFKLVESKDVLYNKKNKRKEQKVAPRINKKSN